MAKGTFVYSAVAPKNAEQKRRVKFRDSGVRYFVILLAILVVFFYEYCFDTPSVSSSKFRPLNNIFKRTTFTKKRNSWKMPNSIYCTQSTRSQTSLFPSSEAP
jgi:hypothetical protein